MDNFGSSIMCYAFIIKSSYENFMSPKIQFLGVLSNIQGLYMVHDNINVAFGMFTTQVYDSGEFPYSIR